MATCMVFTSMRIRRGALNFDTNRLKSWSIKKENLSLSSFVKEKLPSMIDHVDCQWNSGGRTNETVSFIYRITKIKGRKVQKFIDYASSFGIPGTKAVRWAEALREITCGREGEPNECPFDDVVALDATGPLFQSTTMATMGLLRNITPAPAPFAGIRFDGSSNVR